ncbi:MAG: hypothetical protein IMZ47_09595 [Firmicutes bacterium]|nr:hypothetical protein [Bacillota bacterium]
MFVGVTVAPSINFNIVKASNDNNFVEVTTQACGINGFGNTTVKLTKQQASEVDNLFESIKTKLDNATDRAETITFFKEVIVKLNKYRLLPRGMNIEEAFKLMSNEYKIYGESTKTYFLEPMGVFLYQLSNRLNLFDFGYSFFLQTFRNPVQLGSWIAFGYALRDWEGHIEDWKPAEGWIKIVSSQHSEEYNGTFYGQLDSLEGFTWNPAGYIPHYCIGITGFKGLNIGNYYIGSARLVNIKPNPPTWF